MAGENDKHYLVSFEGVSASVGGYDISNIMEMQLTATANSVPQITLMVDIGPDGSNRQAAPAVSLDDARYVFDRCREMVRKDGATLSLSISCRTVGPGKSGVQSLNINGWLLTDIAISPVVYRGVCTASLTFQHPLCKAHLGGAVPALVYMRETPGEVEDGNPFAVFIRTLRAYEAAQREAQMPVAIPGAAAPEEVREQLLSRLAKATSDLEAALTWTHGGLPAFGYLAGWSSLLCRGLSIYAMPSGGNSVLQALLGGLVPECSLAVGGDYTKQALEIGPFEPWADASLTISDSDIVSLSFPPTDPAPLSGVRVCMSLSGSDGVASYHPISCQAGDDALPAETFYIPDSELSSDYLYGPIQQFQEPGWLVSMASFEAATSSRLVSDSFMAAGGGLQTAAGTPRGGSVEFGAGIEGGSSIDYSQATLACAKAYFETSLMKDWVFTATARLMFSAQGGILCPGRVIAVRSGSGEVLGGYVVAVEHVISVANRNATTRITCSHPRFGALPAAITSKTNALY